MTDIPFIKFNYASDFVQFSLVEDGLEIEIVHPFEEDGGITEVLPYREAQKLREWLNVNLDRLSSFSRGVNNGPDSTDHPHTTSSRSFSRMAP